LKSSDGRLAGAAARLGHGAWLDGRPIRVNPPQPLAMALVAAVVGGADPRVAVGRAGPTSNAVVALAVGQRPPEARLAAAAVLQVDEGHARMGQHRRG
jgi:hypothetical protein